MKRMIAILCIAVLCMLSLLSCGGNRDPEGALSGSLEESLDDRTGAGTPDGTGEPDVPAPPRNAAFVDGNPTGNKTADDIYTAEAVNES